MKSALASVIIPNWNGAHLLPCCLDALRRQTFRAFETVVIDNGSTDASPEVLAGYPEVTVVRLPENRFFAGAVNEGIRRTSAPFVVLLNNDTEPEPEWLERLIGGLEQHPEAGMAASKLLLFDRRNVLHSAGDSYGLDGVPRNRGVWEEDQGQYDGDLWVFSACGGAAAYRRSMLDAIGLFDEDLVAYCEDVDLAFRAQLAGYRCLFVPSARVYHKLSATGGGAFASYYCGRNFLAVLAKDLPGSLLVRHWPAILAVQLGFLWQSLHHLREPAARARLAGQLAGLRVLPRMWSKRSQVFALRRVTDDVLESILVTAGGASSRSSTLS